MRTSEINKKAICKNCLKSQNAATSLQDYAPQEDDISVCVYCHAISKFDSEFCLVPLTDEEIKDVRENNRACWEQLQSVLILLGAKQTNVSEQ